jgi:ABC-2 type transport system permease protein
MTFLNVRAIYKIARLEFVRVMIHPVVPVACLIVLAVALLNGAGYVTVLQKFDNIEVALVFGFCHSCGAISMICTVMAVFLGATMIPYERWKNSLNVLLAKPLYRKDYLLGKFVGLSAFMLLFNTFTLLLVSLAMIMFFRGPESGFEFTWRLIAYILVLTLICSLVIALNMFFSLIAKNILFVTAASITYVFFDWIWYYDRIIGSEIIALITPINLFSKLMNPFQSSFSLVLFNTTVPMGQWLDAIVPFLALLLIEILVLLLVEIYIFSREDTV